MRKNKVPKFIFLRSKSSQPIRKKIQQRKNILESLMIQNENEKEKEKENKINPENKKNRRMKMKINEEEKKRIESIFFPKKKNNPSNPLQKKKKNKVHPPRKRINQLKNDKNINNDNNKNPISTKLDNVHVVIAHYNEDLNWVSDLKYNYTIISRYGLPKETPPNKGNEASSYLEYIIKNYHQLKEYTIFVHGHETAYHHLTPIQNKINNLIFNKTYYNINEMPVHTHGRVHNNFMKIIEEKILKRTIQEHHQLRPCAMFYVHRDLILHNPLEVYQELYDYLMTSNEESYHTGRYFEFTWHIIFTHQDDDTT